MKIGDIIKVNGEKLIYTRADVTIGEYVPVELLVSIETGAVYKLPEAKSVDEALNLVKKDSTYLVNITAAPG